MKINLSPQRRDDKFTVYVIGDRITVNGEEFDFSDVSEGATINGFEDIPYWFLANEVGRKDGEIYLTLILPHGPNPSQSMAFPESIHVTKDGPVDLPKDPGPEPIVWHEEEEAIENDMEA